MQAQGFDVTHVYGLTETYGPAVICSWDPDWNHLPLPEQARIRYDHLKISFQSLLVPNFPMVSYLITRE